MYPADFWAIACFLVMPFLTISYSKSPLFFIIECIETPPIWLALETSPPLAATKLAIAALYCYTLKSKSFTG
jgi:hypothetical protein